MALANEIKRAIWRVAPDTGIFNVMPVTGLSANTIWQSQFWGIAAKHLLRRCTDARNSRDLWSDGLLRDSTHAGDWCSNRTGPAVARRVEAGPQKWAVARNDWFNHRACRRCSFNTTN